MSLVWRLYLLVALAMLPAVAIQVWNEVSLRHERTNASHAEALRLAEFASAEMERLVDGGRILLTTLASASSIRLRQAQGCSVLVEQATAGLPQFAMIGAIDPDGGWVCRVGTGTGLDEAGADSRWRQLALDAAETRMLGFVPGGADGRPLLVLVRAFTDFAGQPGGALVVGFDLDWLQGYFTNRSLPPDGSIAIADREGRLLLRLPGAVVPGTMIQNEALLAAARPGTVDAIGPDDTSRIVGYVPPADRLGREFLVLVGIAKAPAMAAIDNATRRSIVLIGLGAVLALVAAWLGSKLFIGRPARALLSAADAWGRGELSARTGLSTGGDEFGRLASAFDRMAEVLEAREAELRASHAELQARDEMLALVEQSAETGSWDVDLASKTVRGTPNFFRLHGVEPADGPVPHELVRASQHPDDRPRVAAEFAAVVASSGDGFEVEYRVKGREGWHWLLGRGHVVRDGKGKAIGYAGIDMDITGRKRAEAALRAGEARLRLALEAGRMGVFDVDVDNQRLIWDDLERQLYGVEPGDTPKTPGQALELIHVEDREACRRAIEAAAASLSDYRIEFRVAPPEGGMRWLAQRGMVLRNAQGGLRLTGVDWDITERKLLEERQHLLIGELNHRVKNLLAVMQSIVQQSGRHAPTAEALQQALHGRLRAMAVAHEILATRQWGGAELQAVLRATLAPHIEGEADDRLVLDVQPLTVAPSTAQSLSLAMHELATNAIKYGSWSVPGGSVRIEGRSDGAGGYQLTWSESGGPPVETPAHKGFGSLLLSRAFAYETGGKAILEWRTEGLRCVIGLPGRR
ncbi:MAG TPA: PAS domain-containing protein [Geminicoccaceae bacterium]|nr:PAS domain-containing protein [Geminicoccus sp.]HMU53091.1 PAS domain-containing protein [Geminicoccaceae bacterium]